MEKDIGFWKWLWNGFRNSIDLIIFVAFFMFLVAVGC